MCVYEFMRTKRYIITGVASSIMRHIYPGRQENYKTSRDHFNNRVPG